MSGLSLREIIVGQPGAGKTALAIELAQRDLSLGRWHFAHDRSGAFVAAGLAYYDSPEAFWAAAAEARRERAMLPRGAAVDAAAAEDVIALAKRWVELAHVETVVTIDEAALFARSGSTWTGKELEELFARSRHMGDVRDESGQTVRKVGLGVRICTQRPTQIPATCYELASRVYLLRFNRRDKIERLEAALDVDGLAEVVTNLRRAEPGRRGGQYIAVEPGVGVVAIDASPISRRIPNESGRRGESGDATGRDDSPDHDPRPDAVGDPN